MAAVLRAARGATGKAVFVAGALPGERVLRAADRAPAQFRRGPHARGAAGLARSRRASLPALRHLWRLRPAAPGRGPADPRQAARADG